MGKQFNGDGMTIVVPTIEDAAKLMKLLDANCTLINLSDAKVIITGGGKSAPPPPVSKKK